MTSLRLSNLFKKQPLMDKARPLHCVFYSHIWTAYVLEELGLVNPKTDILLELATESHFAAALNPFNNYHESLPNLLQPNKHLHQLGNHFKNIAAPIVMAPHPTSNLNVMLAALALVRTDPSPIEKAVVLVHINDAAKFASAYANMDQFSIVWDVADSPSESLPVLAQVLATEQCLDETRWQGIHLCNHKQRQLPDSDAKKQALQQMLNEFSTLKAA